MKRRNASTTAEIFLLGECPLHLSNKETVEDDFTYTPFMAGETNIVDLYKDTPQIDIGKLDD